MRRFALGLTLGLLLVLAPTGRAQTPAELAETARFVAALQNPDGGFPARPGGPSALGSTNAGARALEYTGGAIPDPAKCRAYVRSCFDAEAGGFAPTPGGSVDVGSTAVGLLAVGDLGIDDPKTIDAAVAYLSKHAEGFPEIRIAVAGLEAVNRTAPAVPEWIEQVRSMRNPDGTWGQGARRAFDTGGAAAALLRMGAELDRKDAVLDAMRAGQRPDGGWSEGDGPSTLSATYRVMRAFFMMKERPDLDRVRSFIGRCRGPNGGYAPAPGGTADTGGTYMATICLRWARLLDGEPALTETAGFTPLFNGQDLSGWEGDESLWSARDGMLVGKSPGLKKNNFLVARGTYGDFILKLTFRLVDGQGNSGVQFRSVRGTGDPVPEHEMIGYQADIGEGYWGCLYDESRRNRVLARASDRALEALRKDGWNEYAIRAMGDHITLTLNGVRSVDYREDDPDIARDGRIAVQIHSGPPMEVQFKNLLIQRLPRPDDSAAATAPGFHRRTVTAAGGERPYVVYVPEGYDGRKSFPVVLFLHGAGERGEDGIVPSQVGLGAAIAGHPSDYPFLAVFPQARRSWAADTDDATAALAALDDVMRTYKADPDRVILTGLSMGGAGTWSIGAAQPERFAALVPVCGFAGPEVVEAVKGLPVWTFVGDADSPRIVTSTRALAAALRDAGARSRETEYRGVGHNSWDRAYNDPALIDWMLSQSRKARE